MQLTAQLRGVRASQDGGGMRTYNERVPPTSGQPSSVDGLQLHGSAEQCPRGCRSQRHHDCGLDARQLSVKKRSAKLGMKCFGALVKALLVLLFVVEVLYGIGQVDLLPLKPHRVQRVHE